VRLKLYKGSVNLVGRESPWSLYDQDLVSFEEGSGGGSGRGRLRYFTFTG
jgi:argininosuccinate synthase